MAKQPRKPNMQQMMAQVQKMQRDMELAQEELRQELVEATAGGGAVLVKMSGDLQVREVRIDPAALDPEDAEILGEMVLDGDERRPAQGPGAGRAEDGRCHRGARSGRPRWAGPSGSVSDASYAPPVRRLMTELAKLPGVGHRTAQRLAFHILRAPPEEAAGLAEAIVEVKQKITLCERCFNLTDEPRCRICADARRDQALICVVEEPSDVIPMERTHEYHGVYHVLGGALSPIDGVDPEDLKIAELLDARDHGGHRGHPGEGSGARHQPHHHRRGHGAVHRRGAALASAPGERHPAGQRTARGLGPRVRRRGHARQGVRRQEGAVSEPWW